MLIFKAILQVLLIGVSFGILTVMIMIFLGYKNKK